MKRKKQKLCSKKPAGLKHEVLKKPAGLKHEVQGKPKVGKKGFKRDADSLGIPIMPKESKDGNPAAVQYLGGVIYTVQDQCKLRCLKTKGDRYSETCKKWGSIRTK